MSNLQGSFSRSALKVELEGGVVLKEEGQKSFYLGFYLSSLSLCIWQTFGCWLFLSWGALWIPWGPQQVF